MTEIISQQKPFEPFYCVGDIHQHCDTIEKVIKIAGDKKIIWLSDFLDSHMQEVNTKAMFRKTCFLIRWIVENRPQDILLESNHMLSYRFPQNRKYHGYGFSFTRWANLNELFPDKYWQRFKLFHVEEWNNQKILFSHAGYRKEFLPMEEFHEGNMRRMEKLAYERARHTHLDNPLFDDYGLCPLWVRWQNLKVIPGINQCVGHTEMSEPTRMFSNECENWNLNLDCAHSFLAEFSETGIYSINHHNGQRKKII